MDFINKNNIQILTYDPTEIYTKLITKLIKSSYEIIPKGLKNSVSMKSHKISPPKLHSFIKLHKEDHPIHPLINFRTAPSYLLAKYLDSFIK